MDWGCAVRKQTERVDMPIRWIVRGSLSFPIDMLRYDAAWPATETDSNAIQSTFWPETKGLVQVEVYARRNLTVGRWRSFGWDVIGVS